MDISNTQITRRQEKVFNDLKDEFKKLYDKNDFIMAMNALKAAGNTSARGSRLKQLYDMFDACSITYEKGMENDYYERVVRDAELPSFDDIQNRIMNALFEMYKAYASPENFMQRIVDRLSREHDKWDDNTLRLRILKQFIKYGDYLPGTHISCKGLTMLLADFPCG